MFCTPSDAPLVDPASRYYTPSILRQTLTFESKTIQLALLFAQQLINGSERSWCWDSECHFKCWWRFSVMQVMVIISAVSWATGLVTVSPLSQEASSARTTWRGICRLLNSVWECPNRVIKDTLKLWVLRATCGLLTQPAFMWVARARWAQVWIDVKL